MNIILKQILLVLSLSSITACAGTNERGNGTPNEPVDGRRDCIPEPSIRGYAVLDEQNLIVDASGRRQYHVVLQRRAFGLKDSVGIVFDSPTGRICSSFSEVVFGGSFGVRADAIRIEHIRLLSPEEEENLLIRFGKKEPEIRQTPAPREVEGADVEELDPAASE